MRKKVLICFFILGLVFLFCRSSFAESSFAESSSMQVSDFAGDYKLTEDSMEYLSKELPFKDLYGNLMSVRLHIRESGESSLFIVCSDESTVPGTSIISFVSVDCTVKKDKNSGKCVIVSTGHAHIDIVMTSPDSECFHIGQEVAFDTSSTPDELSLESKDNNIYLQCGKELTFEKCC